MLMVLSAKYLYLVVVVISLWFMVKNYSKRILIFSVVILPLVYIVAQIAGKIFYDPRPFVIGHFIPLVVHAANNGFPSDHSLISFALASIVFLFNKKLGFVLFILGFLVGLSRVYVGIHHPVDILGSFLICVVVASICAKIVSWKK